MTTQPRRNCDGNGEDSNNNNGGSNGNGGTIDIYYDTGNVSDDIGIFVAVARAAVDAATATANQ
jgi:hypothetical protein